MKKELILSLIVVAMCVILLIGCQKDNRYVYTPNDELYEYCAFDSLSYWIYEDSATLQIDSVVAIKKLSKYTDLTMESGCYPDGRVLTYKQCYNIINTNDNSFRSEYIEPSVYYPKPEESAFDLRAEELYVIMPYSGYRLGFNDFNCYYANIYTPSEIVYTYGTGIGYKYSTHYDNITINNNLYQDVKKIEFYIYPFFNEVQVTDTIVCYWAKHIGIIRHEIHSDSIKNIRNLKYYNVKNVCNQY